MIAGRHVRRFATGALAAAAMVTMEVGSAAAQVLLGHINFNHGGTICTSETGGGAPTPSIIFGIGHGFVDAAGAVGSNAPFGPLETGSRDFNASNSPKFPQLVGNIVNGADDELFTSVALQIPSSLVAVSSTRRESAFPELNGAPDLTGGQVSFVRLVVTNSVLSIEACPPGQSGARAFAQGRWEFWGNSPAPAPPPPLTVVLSPLGCTMCHVGDFAQFRLTLVNPGPARTVELKVASRFPDGTTIFSILDPHTEQFVDAGATLQLDLPGINIPSGLPFGTYLLEAAVMEPQLGRSVARDGFPAQLVP